MSETEVVDVTIAKDVRYVGTLKHGLFHGTGMIVFKNEGVFNGIWEEGKRITGTYKFPDGLECEEENWPYCTMKDRRFWTEIVEGVPPDFSQETNRQPVPILPFSYYDVGDGIYNPLDDTICNYKGHFLRKPDDNERKWIFKFCRRGVTEDIEKECSAHIDFMFKIVDRVESAKDVKCVVSKVSDTVYSVKDSVDEIVDQVIQESPIHTPTDESQMATLTDSEQVENTEDLSQLFSNLDSNLESSPTLYEERVELSDGDDDNRSSN